MASRLIQHIAVLAIILLHRCRGDQCTVATGDRDLCMYEVVPQTACENEGCCYDTMTSPNCYYSNAEGMLMILFRRLLASFDIVAFSF